MTVQASTTPPAIYSQFPAAYSGSSSCSIMGSDNEIKGYVVIPSNYTWHPALSADHRISDQTVWKSLSFGQDDAQDSPNNSRFLYLHAGSIPAWDSVIERYTNAWVVVTELPAYVSAPTAIAHDTQSHTSEQAFRGAFSRAATERFHDGMQSNFANELEVLAQNHPFEIRPIIIRLLNEKNDSPDVFAEVMRWIGNTQAPISIEDRLIILSNGLDSSQYLVRDGAILGLASLDNPVAIPHLERAIAKESSPVLRKDMEQALQELKQV